MRALKTAITVIFMFSLISLTFGQSDYDKETFDDAEYFFVQEDYSESIVSYLRLYKRGYSGSANINYRIGICYLNSNTEKEKAVPYLEFAVTKVTAKYKEGELKEENAPYDAYLYLGNTYRINMQHDKAIAAYTKFLEITASIKNLEMEHNWVQTQIEACKRAKIATNNLVRVKYLTLGKPINTSATNNYPAISSNEEYIAFITKQKFYSALMLSKKKKGKWETPRNITPEIMSDGDQVPVYLSDNGKTLLLAKFENENCDIYISTSDGKTWSPSVPIGKEVNTKYWESHACLSKDGKTIYFTSNRPQSLGGTDIFYSTQTADGKWAPAINLGSNINTPSNEETPYLGPEGTLYFSSQGHATIGGFDICYSKMDETGKWSNAINLGYPINTTDDDLFYVPVSNKHFAYTAKAMKGGFGDLDIVRVETFSDEHPYTFSIKGNLSQLLKNEQPANYRISLIEYESKKVLETVKPTANGDFTFTKVAGTYIVSFVSDSFSVKGNYFIVPENYPSEVYSLTPDILNISDTYEEYLASKKVGTKKVAKVAKVFVKDQRPALIHNILFSFAESKLTKDAENELDTIAKLMIEVPSLQVEIIGYTDGLGSEQFNQQLSEKRAASVKKRLLGRGVTNDRVIISGKGETNPIALNENPDGSDNPIGRAFNRRVEFFIIKSNNKNIKVDKIRVPAELKP